MIVIATNNGYLYLKELLDSFSNVDICDEEIIIVDTKSNDLLHLDFLKNVKGLYPNLKINVTETPNRNFDTGAYIHTYKNFKSKNYIFLHDSIIIKSRNFIKDIKEFLDENQVVVFSYFNFMGYGDLEWKTFFNKNTGLDKYEIGIFGPMFACNIGVLDNIDFDKLELPINKNQQACFEGIWPTIFKNNNTNMLLLEESNGTFNSKYIYKKIIHRN